MQIHKKFTRKSELAWIEICAKKINHFNSNYTQTMTKKITRRKKKESDSEGSDKEMIKLWKKQDADKSRVGAKRGPYRSYKGKPLLTKK